MALEIVTRQVDDLIPYARNARTHSPAQVAQIAASITEFGFTNPVLTHGDGILAGHGRILAARKLGMATVPTLDLSHLTKTQARAYILADNQLSLNAGWEAEMLALELTELDAEGFDLDLLGFDDVAGLMNPEPEGGLKPDVDEDAVPDAPKVAITKPGDIITLGRHRLRCGDSTNPQHVDELMGGGAADIVFTDPPYGISVQMNNPGTTCKGTIMGDKTTAVAVDAFALCMALDLPLIFWGANHYCQDANLPNASCWITWDKQEGNHIDQADCELAWTNIKGPARIFKHLWAGFRRDSEKGEKRVHPTQKPVALVQEILEFFKAGRSVLDLFGGSGSTLIACEKTSRVCFMMELDPIYCDVIVSRWEQATGKTAVRP